MADVANAKCKKLNRRLPKWTTSVVFTEKRKKRRPIKMPVARTIFSRARNIDLEEMLVWDFQRVVVIV